MQLTNHRVWDYAGGMYLTVCIDMTKYYLRVLVINYEKNSDLFTKFACSNAV